MRALMRGVSRALLRGLTASGVVKAYQPLPELGVRIRASREDAVQARWAVMEAELPDPPGSLLDVGCNVGFYVLQAARRGHFATGIDFPRYSLALGLAAFALGESNAQPLPRRLTPANAAVLPTFDVVIALQVFHHLCRAHGADGGTDILRSLWRRCRQRMLFETEALDATGDAFRASMPAMPDGVEAWVRAFFDAEGASGVRVLYRDEGRERILFAIDRG